jgi:PAS domain S-box-containing protein
VAQKPDQEPRDPEGGSPGAAGEPEVDADRLLKAAISSIRDYAIFALDLRGYIVTWNPGAERIKGYLPAEIIGKHFSVFYPPEDLAWDKPAFELKEAVRLGRFEDEGWRLRKDGTRFWANVVITLVRGPDGERLGFAKVTRDLTERRAAEEGLRASEERFRLLVHSVKDYGIFMLDPVGTVRSWNEGAERMKGYTADEIIGRHFSVFYPPEDLAWDKPAFELKEAVRLGRFEDEGWRLRKDGTRFWANVVITPLYGGKGSLIGFTKVTRDLTERRATEERTLENARRVAAEETARQMAEERNEELTTLLEQMHLQAIELEHQREQADTANRAKMEFLASMSHELRTPLNAIGGYTELLHMGLRGPVTDEQRQDLERIRRSQQHLLGIINDLLNFTRLEAGKVVFEPGPVSLVEVRDAVAPMIAPQAHAQGLAFHTGNCPPDVVAVADRAKVEQILLNLLSNAVKFTDPGGVVELGCTADGDRVRLWVRDTGMGISEDKLEAVFEPFVQVGRSLARPLEGTGLGLSISRELARGMGGDLAVESTEGEGSTFTLVLPRARE